MVTGLLVFKNNRIFLTVEPEEGGITILETSVNAQPTARRHMPEDLNLAIPL
jgi:hypothetical protein